MRIRNFGRNIDIRPAVVIRAASEAEVRALLERLHAGDPSVRCRGGLHSWSRIVDTRGLLIDVRALDRVEYLPGAAPRVRVGAGCPLWRVLQELYRYGMTLPTLGANHCQTVAGAISTGTHGSGRPSLSHYVERVRLLVSDAKGASRVEVIESDAAHSPQSEQRLRAARCGLGAMGVITELEMSVVPTYRVKQSVRKFTSLQRAIAGWKDGRWPLQQFALFPWSWTYVVYRRRVSAAAGWCVDLRTVAERFKRAIVEDRLFHWLLVALLCLPRRWRDRAARWLMGVVPRLIAETRYVDDSDVMFVMRHDLVRYVEMELFIAESRLTRAVMQLRRLVEIAGGQDQRPSDDLASELRMPRERLEAMRGTYTVHYPLFFRRVRHDDTLVSMASPPAASMQGAGTVDWISISFVTYRCRDSAFEAFCALVAEAMVNAHEARVHWGKFFPAGLGDCARTYPSWDRFQAVCRSLDPNGRFWPTLPPSDGPGATVGTRSSG